MAAPDAANLAHGEPMMRLHQFEEAVVGLVDNDAKEQVQADIFDP
jgi:hypothetical protein